MARLDHRTPALEEEDNACNFAEVEDSPDRDPLVGLKADHVRHRLEELHAEDREVCLLHLGACLQHALMGMRYGLGRRPALERRRV